MITPLIVSRFYPIRSAVRNGIKRYKLYMVINDYNKYRPVVFLFKALRLFAYILRLRFVSKLFILYVTQLHVPVVQLQRLDHFEHIAVHKLV